MIDCSVGVLEFYVLIYWYTGTQWWTGVLIQGMEWLTIKVTDTGLL